MPAGKNWRAFSHGRGKQMVVVTGVQVPIGEPEEAAIALAKRRLGAAAGEVKRACVVKVSVDARRRQSIVLVYSVGFELADERAEAAAAAQANAPDVTLRVVKEEALLRGIVPLAARPVVAGFGPAGMFAALLLAREGYRPLVLERGADVDKRVRAVEGFWNGGALDSGTNVQFGAGGAGTFSDGKLTTRIGDWRCAAILRELHRFGAPPEILFRAKPHIGTDMLRGIVEAIRAEIVSLGGEVRFETQLTGITAGSGGVTGVTADGQALAAGALVLAVGHSARDTFELLRDTGFALEQKPFSVGVRIEHRQSDIDRALFGEFAGHPALGHGEYQLSLRRGARCVYTFCMCPGGTVVPSASEQGGVVVNGMSEYARAGKNANAALVVSVDGSDFGPDVLGGVAFQRGLERAAYAAGGSDWRAPAQSAGAFLQRRPGLAAGGIEPTYARGVKEAELGGLFPEEISDMLRMGLTDFGRRLRGFSTEGALLTGVETRTSSPVRVLRGENGQALQTPGVYPCGEGAGYAGGIMSAAADGLRAAEHIIAAGAPPRGETD